MPPARFTALMAQRWLRLPPSTARPLIWQTPRLVLRIDFSRSWAAKALPVSSTSTQPVAHQPGQGHVAAGVDDGGPGHHHDLLPRLARLAHLARRARDDDALVDLRGDVVGHEAEDREVAAALRRPHADARARAGPPARPSCTWPCFTQVGRAVAQDERAVHLLVARRPPTCPSMRTTVSKLRGGVELVGQDAVRLRGREARRRPPTVAAPEVAQVLQDAVERLRRRRPSRRGGRTTGRRWSCRPGTPGPRTRRPPPRCARRPGAGCRSR